MSMYLLLDRVDQKIFAVTSDKARDGTSVRETEFKTQ